MIRNQGTGIKKQGPEIKNLAPVIKKRILGVQRIIIAAGIIFLIPVTCFLALAQAKSLGTHGIIYPIDEQDPIGLIQQKITIMQENGELTRRNQELQKKSRVSVERPKAVEGITRATTSRVFYYDPTYVVQIYLKDQQGQIFVKKGTKINPLETVSLSTNLLFFDGDDEEQLAWVKEQLYGQPIVLPSDKLADPSAEQTATQNKQNEPIKLILVKGAPLKLSRELGVPVYFDQLGALTKKLGIQQAPALVTQEKQKLKLKIEEIKLSPSGERETEGDI